MILIGCVAELIIIFLWYKLILSKQIKSKKIVRRSINIFYMQRKNIILYFLGEGGISEEQKKDFYNIMNYLVTIFIRICYVTIYIIIAPIVIKQIISYENSKIVRDGIYLILLCAVLFSCLKRYTQYTVETINQYIQDVMIPLEKKPELLRPKDAKKPIIKWNTTLIISIYMIAMVSCIILTEQVNYIKLFYVIIAVLLIFVLIKHSNDTRKKAKLIVPKGVCVDGYILESIQDDIANMCLQLGIENLECKIIDTEEIYVHSEINENNIPQIDISNGFISIIYHYYARDILLITIAHELGHIYYNDSLNIKKRLRTSNFVNFLLIILTMLGLMLSLISPIFFIMPLLILVIEIVFGKVMCDVRYWRQIAELRADRLAINVCKCNKMAFVTFWKQYSKHEKKEKTNIIDQFYRKYVKIEGHPAMERRMKLIEKREKWSWWEYFEHALIIIKWRMTNKGWNGIL